MTTNAKGQLGGLDSPDHVRRRLASESPAFKCAVCGKTNGDIIKECEERAKEAGEPSEDVQVPQDLNMGTRDEMEAAAAAAATAAAKTGEDTTAELAEGFVQTVPIAATAGDAGTTASDATPSSAARARPAQSVPQPTRTVPTPSAPLQEQQQQQQMARRAADDGIPVWIDRMIVVLVVLLAALVLKVLFGV